MPKYQVRIRHELNEQDKSLEESAKEHLGAVSIRKIVSYNSVEMESFQVVLDNLNSAGIDLSNVLSIIEIHEDNSDQLGEDFDWSENNDH